MGRHDRRRSERQRKRRRRLNERAFIFEGDFSRCLGMVDRESWEFAVSMCGGNVAEAARQCGIDGVPEGAKALWGASKEAALQTYRAWQHRKRTKP